MTRDSAGSRLTAEREPGPTGDKLAATPWQVAAATGIGALGASFVGLTPGGALLVAVAIVFVFLTSLRTKVGAYFIALPLIYQLKYSFPNTEVQGVPDLIALTLLAHVVWDLMRERLRIPLSRPYVVLAFAFAVSVIIYSRTPLVASAGVGIEGARTYLEPFVLFIVGLVFFRTPDDARFFMRIAAFTALVVGVVTLKQLALGFSGPEIGYHIRSLNERVLLEKRVFSTLGSPETFAFVATLFMLLGVAGLAAGLSRRWMTIVALISALGVLASGTRIAIVAAVPASLLLLGMLIVDPRHQRFARALGLMGVCAIVTLGTLVAVTPSGDRDDTFESGNAIEATVQKLALLKRGSADDDINGRLERTEQFLDFMRRHPLGVGAGLLQLFTRTDAFNAAGQRVQVTPVPDYIKREPWIFQRDYFYFGLGAELGLIPLAIYVLLLLGGVLLGIEAWSRHTDPAIRALMAFAASTAVLALLHNLTNESFRNAQMAGYVWFMLAAPVAYAWVAPPRKTAAGVAPAVGARSD